MDLSERIKSIRLDKGLKQSDLAKALSIEQSNYNRFERRGSRLTLEQIEKIADALRVPVAELLGFHNISDNQYVKELEDKINSLEQENEHLKSENQNLIKEQDRLNETLGLVRGLMDLVNRHPQQVSQLENDLFDGDDIKKERIKKKVTDRIENPDKDTK